MILVKLAVMNVQSQLNQITVKTSQFVRFDQVKMSLLQTTNVMVAVSVELCAKLVAVLMEL